MLANDEHDEHHDDAQARTCHQTYPCSTRMSGTKVNLHQIPRRLVWLYSYLGLASLSVASMNTTAAIDVYLLFRLSMNPSASCSSAFGSQINLQLHSLRSASIQPFLEASMPTSSTLALIHKFAKAEMFSCLFC